MTTRPNWMPKEWPLTSPAHDPVNDRWAIVTGRHDGPIPISLIPPPPLLPPWYGGTEVADGAVYGPVAHAQAVEVSNLLTGHTMLAIIPGGGVQTIYVKGSTRKKLSSIFGNMGRRIPGMVFFPDGPGVLMIGYGPRFEPIHTDNVVASCDPGMAFPGGASYEGPAFDSREGLVAKPVDRCKPHDWTPTDMATLEDLAPLAFELASMMQKGGV